MDMFVGMIAICAAIAVVIPPQHAAATTTHVVGDGLGWRIPPNATVSYVNWASGKRFVVGDTLVFNFVTNQHDVARVPKASFDACSSENNIGNLNTNGPANVTLEASGEHYYICTFSGHCNAGQKLAITVVSGSEAPGRAPPPTTTGAPPPPTPCPQAPSPTYPPPPPPPYSSSSGVFANIFLCLISAAIYTTLFL